jgi:hypothetical protein
MPTTVIHSTYVIQFFPFYITDPALLLQCDAACRFIAVRRNAVSSSVAPRPLRPSPTTSPLQPTLFHHIRKILPPLFGKNAVPFVRNDKIHDPLDVRLFTLLLLPLASRLPYRFTLHRAYLPITQCTSQPRYIQE